MIITKKCLVHDIFEDQIGQGNIYNGFMNVDNNNKIISFQMGCITLEENTNYEDIRYTIDELN